MVRTHPGIAGEVWNTRELYATETPEVARQESDYEGSYEAARQALLTRADEHALSLWLEPQRVSEAFDWLTKIFLAARKFSAKSALDAVVAHVMSRNVLKYFQGVNLCGLPLRVLFVQLLRNRLIPLYSLGELANLTEELIPYLLRNRQSILEDPQRGHDYKPPLWFYLLLSWLCRVKVPASQEATQDRGWDDVISYHWPPEPGDGIPRPEGFFESQTLDEMLGFPQTGPRRESAQDIRANRVEGTASDKNARSTISLTPDDVARWEALRPKLFDLKVLVLEELLLALRSRTPARLWRNCLRLLTEKLSPADVDFCLRLDRTYTGFDLRTGRKERDKAEVFIGGLTDLLLTIGHYEKELVVGTFTRTREALGELVKPDRQQLPRLIVENYFESIGLPEKETLDTAYDVFTGLGRQEEGFWEEYRTRVNEALKNTFMATLKIEPELMPSVSGYYRWAKAHKEMSGKLPELRLTTPRLPSSEKTETIVPFPSPEGLRWDEVTITFDSNHSVRIDARGVCKRFTFAEIGFKDGRRIDMPDSRWKILKEGFAKHKGAIHWGTELDEKTKHRMKAAVKDIRKRLKAIMGIEDDPFHPYREVRAYRLKFTIRDDTPKNSPSY